MEASVDLSAVEDSVVSSSILSPFSVEAGRLDLNRNDTQLFHSTAAAVAVAAAMAEWHTAAAVAVVRGWPQELNWRHLALTPFPVQRCKLGPVQPLPPAPGLRPLHGYELSPVSARLCELGPVQPVHSDQTPNSTVAAAAALTWCTAAAARGLVLAGALQARGPELEQDPEPEREQRQDPEPEEDLEPELEQDPEPERGQDLKPEEDPEPELGQNLEPEEDPEPELGQDLELLQRQEPELGQDLEPEEDPEP